MQVCNNLWSYCSCIRKPFTENSWIAQNLLEWSHTFPGKNLFLRRFQWKHDPVPLNWCWKTRTWFSQQLPDWLDRQIYGLAHEAGHLGDSGLFGAILFSCFEGRCVYQQSSHAISWSSAFLGTVDVCEGDKLQYKQSYQRSDRVKHSGVSPLHLHQLFPVLRSLRVSKFHFQGEVHWSLAFPVAQCHFWEARCASRSRSHKDTSPWERIPPNLLNTGASRLIRETKNKWKSFDLGKVQIKQVINHSSAYDFLGLGINWEFGLSLFGLNGTHLYLQSPLIQTRHSHSDAIELS